MSSREHAPFGGAARANTSIIELLSPRDLWAHTDNATVRTLSFAVAGGGSSVFVKIAATRSACQIGPAWVAGIAFDSLLSLCLVSCYSNCYPSLPIAPPWLLPFVLEALHPAFALCTFVLESEWVLRLAVINLNLQRVVVVVRRRVRVRSVRSNNPSVSKQAARRDTEKIIAAHPKRLRVTGSRMKAMLIPMPMIPKNILANTRPISNVANRMGKKPMSVVKAPQNTPVPMLAKAALARSGFVPFSVMNWCMM